MFAKALAVVLNSVQELQEYSESRPNDANQSDEIDVDEVRMILHELAASLEDDDTEAIVWAERLRAHVTQPAMEKNLRRLDKMVGNYDFEEAVHCLSKIAHALGIAIEDHDHA